MPAFERLMPVLPVSDPVAEAGFYAALGFTPKVTPMGFTALQHGDILFGVKQSAAPVPPDDLDWQIWVDGVRDVHDIAVAAGLDVLEAPSQHPVAGFWTMRLRTPAGYVLTLEGPEQPSR